METQEIEFLIESNAIEEEYSKQALEDSKNAWLYAKKHRERSITQILGVHKRLMKNLNSRIAGKIRDIDVYVGNKICVEPYKIKDMLEYLIAIKPLTEQEIKNWHIQFEKIHPFEDGNGRTGRILMNLQRLEIELPLLVIHRGQEQFEYYNWFKRKKSQLQILKGWGS